MLRPEFSFYSGSPPSASIRRSHSLRRTKAVLIYRRTGNLPVQLLLGHSNIESTIRYLGIEVDGPIEMAEKTDI